MNRAINNSRNGRKKTKNHTKKNVHVFLFCECLGVNAAFSFLFSKYINQLLFCWCARLRPVWLTRSPAQTRSLTVSANMFALSLSLSLCVCISLNIFISISFNCFSFVSTACYKHGTKKMHLLCAFS